MCLHIQLKGHDGIKRTGLGRVWLFALNGISAVLCILGESPQAPKLH